MFRDSLLKGSPHKVEPVETPAGKTFVRTITAGEKDEFDRQASKDGKFRCRLVMLSCCKEDGSPEFTNLDLPALDELPVTVLEPIVDAAIALNRIGQRDAEEIRKN